MTKPKTAENTVEIERQAIQHAYAYSRVSTTNQLSGTGIERQAGKPEMICQAHGWALSDQTFADLGVSAHKGKNRLQGDLATFIKLANDNKLLPNPVLILEQWDRFSREDIDESEPAVMALLKTGVAIHIDFANKTFTKSSTKSLGDRIEIMIALKAAYDYSANLSKRIQDAWRKKKSTSTQNGNKPYRFRPFGWLKWNDDKKEYEVIKVKADSIKRLFEIANTGRGVRSVVAALNQERVPTIGSTKNSKTWATISVQRILRGKEVLGFNHNIDPPVKMFPQIIDDKTYYAANARMDERKTNKYYGRTTKAENLFTGVAKCAKCGRAMKFHTSKLNVKKVTSENGYGRLGGIGVRGGKLETNYYKCSGYAEGICSNRMMVYDWVQNSFSQSLFNPDFAEKFNKDSSPVSDNTTVLQGQVIEVQKKLETVTADYNANPDSPRIASTLVKLEAQEKELLAKLESEKTRLIGTTPLSNAYSEFLATLHKDWSNVECRLRLRELIRSMVTKILVDIESKSYEIFFKSGLRTKVECFKSGCRIDGKEYVFTATIQAPKNGALVIRDA